MESTKTKYDIISGLYDGTVRLSHTALNEFAKSPRHFIEYKTGKKERTPAMIFGSLVHCMILEPEEVEERYIVEPEDAPRRPSIRQIEAKNPSASTLESIDFWQNFEELARGKEMISAADWKAAERMKKAVYANDASRYVLDRIEHTEMKIEWQAFGFSWIGFQDGKGDKIILDLKTIRDATPRMIERAILYDGYNRQAAHYTKGGGYPDHQYYVVAVDRGCNVTTVQIKDTTTNAAWEQIDYLCGMFRKCLALNEWDKSYDFWAPNGIYQV